MPIFEVDSGSISDLVVSNSLRATGSLFGTASYAEFSPRADNFNLVVSADTTSNAVSQLVLSNANSVSFGLNASTVTATVEFPGAFTYPYFNPKDKYIQTLGTWGNGSLFMQPVQMQNVQFDRVAIPMYLSNADNNNSTMGLSITLSWGLYTRNASSLSLLTDYSSTTTLQSIS